MTEVLKDPAWITELKSLDGSIVELLSKPDGYIKILAYLKTKFNPKEVSTEGDNQRIWELVGFTYKQASRYFEAITIFLALYEQMIEHQKAISSSVHKGMPLVWISDCYAELNYPAHAKRYLMLTLCEDAIREKGDISPDKSGVYYRLVWKFGLSDDQVNEYAKKIYGLYLSEPHISLYPEWILQELDHAWMTEIPSPSESTLYKANLHYVGCLINQLGGGDGLALERLASYLLSCIPGCRTIKRLRTQSSDYDVICTLDGHNIDFRSQLGRYFVCECKDWDKPVDFSTTAKFCRVLDSVKCQFGIIFSKNGISGSGRLKYADREQLKMYQNRGTVIAVIDGDNLNSILYGSNFLELLRAKYEVVRLDISENTFFKPRNSS